MTGKKKKFSLPLFRLEYSDKFIDEFCKEARVILKNGFLSEGRLSRQWESDFAAFQKVPHALAVTSCTTGLEAILRAIDVRGKKVLMPSNTYFATATAIEASGATPVLLDCDITSFSICSKDLSQKIDDSVGAVIIVHVGGIIAENIMEIKKICDDAGVPLVEDAAHAHGSYLSKDIVAGNIGIAGSFSFFPTKVMTTGEGGMVTGEKDFLDKAKLIKNFGADPDQERKCIVEQGGNYRIHEFTALLGILENKRAESRINRRGNLAKRYVRNLAGSNYIPILQSSGRCSHYKIILMTDTFAPASNLKEFCAKENVTLTGQVYETPVHKQPRFQEQFKNLYLPKTDLISNFHICPPLYPELSNDEVDYACEVLLKYPGAI